MHKSHVESGKVARCDDRRGDCYVRMVSGQAVQMLVLPRGRGVGVDGFYDVIKRIERFTSALTPTGWRCC